MLMFERISLRLRLQAFLTVRLRNDIRPRLLLNSFAMQKPVTESAKEVCSKKEKRKQPAVNVDAMSTYPFPVIPM